MIPALGARRRGWWWHLRCWHRPALVATVLLGAVALAGCRSVEELITPGATREIGPGDPEWDVVVQLRYLGVGGWSIRLGDAHVVTAPFWSNPGMLRVGLGTIAPDETFVREQLRRTPLHDAQALLVGHGHYDHLMDVPVIATTPTAQGGLDPSCIIYGSETVRHLLAPVALPQPIRTVNDGAGDATTPGKWMKPHPDARVRVMAVRSDHAPHFAGMRFLQDGPLTEDRTSLPWTAWFWTLGQTHAWVIDFLEEDGTTPRFRLYYQDSATSPPAGMPPPLDDGKAYDAVIPCLASFSGVHAHPEALILATRPRAVLIGHWEDFFEQRDGSPEPVTGSDPWRFMERLRAVHGPGETTIFPRPGDVFHLPVDATPGVQPR